MAAIKRFHRFTYRGFSYAAENDLTLKNYVRRILKNKDDHRFDHTRSRTAWCDENGIEWHFKVNDPRRNAKPQEVTIDVDLILPSNEDAMAYKLRWDQ